MSATACASGALIAQLAQLLADTIGLDSTTVGDAVVNGAVRRRMTATGISDGSAYLARVNADARELQELVEEVVVPETYFFREPEALTAIAQRVAPAVPQVSAVLTRTNTSSWPICGTGTVSMRTCSFP